MSSGRVKAICNDVRRPAPRHAACANVELRAPTQVPAAFLPLLLHINEFLPLDERSFRGGASKTLTLPRPLSFCESHRQNPAMVGEMDRLLDNYNYADTARILNERGFKTGNSLPLTSTVVGQEPIRTAPQTRPADHR